MALPLTLLHNADDIVLLAPSWRALQELLAILESYCDLLDLVCNSKKTVCMVFSPRDKSRIIAVNFPSFTLNGQALA